MSVDLDLHLNSNNIIEQFIIEHAINIEHTSPSEEIVMIVLRGLLKVLQELAVQALTV